MTSRWKHRSHPPSDPAQTRLSFRRKLTIRRVQVFRNRAGSLLQTYLLWPRIIHSTQAASKPRRRGWQKPEIITKKNKPRTPNGSKVRNCKRGIYEIGSGHL